MLIPAYQSSWFSMAENKNMQTPLSSTAGHTASEVTETNRRKTFSQREVGLTHPDNSSFIRLTDAGDIEIFAAPGVGIVINGSTRTISLFADNIKFNTKEDGLKWNSMEFNHSATSFSEPTFVLADQKSYNPAYLNMDYYINNLDILDKEDLQKSVTINGDYAYRGTTDLSIVPLDSTESLTLDSYFTKEQVTLLQSHWDKYSAAYKKNSKSLDPVIDFSNKIKDYMTNGYSIDQAIQTMTESIGDINA